MPDQPSSPDISSAGATESRLASLISQNLFELPPGFAMDGNLYHAGLDSMALMHLLILIENHFGLVLAEADISRENFGSIRSLCALIRERLAQSGRA